MPTLFDRNNAIQTAARYQAQMEAQGYYAETFPRSSASGTGVTPTQQVCYVAIGLAAGDVVSNISLMVQAAGATVTLAKVGIYSKANVLLASSADASTSFQSTSGVKTIALTLQSNGTPFTVPTTDGYWLAYLAVSAVTMPALWKNSGSNAANNPIGSGAIGMTGIQAGQADLPATSSILYTSTNHAIWMGVS
jgi:hypothetical protein